MSRRWRCAHCGQETTPTGHFRRVTPERPACPHTRTVVPVVPLATGLLGALPDPGAPRSAWGYCCPLDHECLWSSHTAPRRPGWRLERPTVKQMEYLAGLGYQGPRPRTKGEAHDLLSAILSPTEAEPPRERAIRLRLTVP